MELVLLLVGVAVVLISALLVFFVSLKVMKESSYEEVAAEKARQQESVERELGIIRTRDIKKELKKKKEKKVKVVEELDEIEEQEITETPKQGKGKASQKQVSRVESTPPVQKAVEKSDSKKKGKSSQPKSGGDKNSKAKSGKIDFDDFASFEPEAPFIVAESKNKRKKQNVPPEASSSSSPAAKQASPQAARSSSTAVKVQSALRTDAANLKQSTLKVSEPVVEKSRPALSNASNGIPGSEWTTKLSKGDSASVAKKQIDEKNEETNLKSQLLTANSKYAEMCRELSTSLQKYSALESRAQNEVAEKVKEIEALKARLSHSHAEHLKDRNLVNQSPRAPKGPGAVQLNSGETQLIQILTEENRKLKEEISSVKSRPSAVTGPSGGEDLQLKVKFMDDALKQNAVLLNASENAKKTLEQKLKQAEDKFSKLETQMKNVEKKAQSGNEELKKSEEKIKTLSKDLDAAKKELENSQTVKDEEKRTKDLEEKVTSLESQFHVLEQLIKQKDKELESWKEKNSKLTDDLQKKDLEVQNKSATGGKDLDSEVKRLKDELKTLESTKGDLEVELNDYKQQQTKLQADLLHYQTVLADTEKTLIQIQTNAESEEKSWQQNLSAAEVQLHASQDELKQLQEELDVLSKKHESNYNHVEGTSVDTKPTNSPS